jgi:hypothetical protein
MKQEWSDREERLSAGSERVSIKKGMFATANPSIGGLDVWN